MKLFNLPFAARGKGALLVCLLIPLLQFVAERASADAPPYVFKVEEWFTSSNGSYQYNTYTRGSESGIFSYDYNLSGDGISTAQWSIRTQQQANVYAYVRSDLSGPYRLTKNWSGELEVQVEPDYLSRQGLASFPQAGYSWACPGLVLGPDNYFDCPPPNGVVAVRRSSSTSNNGLGITSFPEFPGAQYWYIGYENASAEEGRRYTESCPPYDPPPCDVTSDTPNTRVNVSATYYASYKPRPPRKRTPGCNNGPRVPVQCPGSLVEMSVDAASGNMCTTVDDPIRTRGFPLRNKIHVNSQTVEFDRGLANATFTYDIHVTTQVLNLGGGATTYWILVDGDGSRYIFGPASSAPTPEPGVFSTLIQTTATPTPEPPTPTPTPDAGAFGSLMNPPATPTPPQTPIAFRLLAGPPEDLRSAGNFEYEFDSAGKLLTITDPAGNVQTLTYTNGKLTRVYDESSRKGIIYLYTGDRITQISENGGAILVDFSYVTYGSDARLSGISISNGQYGAAFTGAFTYDPTGGHSLQTFTQDGDTATTKSFSHQWVESTIEPNQWVPLTNVTDVIPGTNPPTGTTGTLLQYDLDSSLTNGSRTAAQNYKGGVTSYDFDSSWNLKRVELPPVQGATSVVVYAMDYDGNKNMTAASDGATSISMDYTTNGKLHRLTNAAGYRQYNYAGNNLDSIEDSLGTLASIYYDDPGLPNTPTSISDALGNTWTYGHNGFGQVTLITPPTGSKIGALTKNYDEGIFSPSYGYLKEIVDADGNITKYESYDAAGNVTSVSTDPDLLTPLTREVTQYSYDGAHRMRTLVHPDTKTIVWNYFGRNLSYIDDEASSRTSFSWCPNCGALKGISRPMNWNLTLTHDSDQEVKALTDPLSHDTKYTYGKALELSNITYPDSSAESYLYDNSGRLRQVKNARNQERNILYNPSGKVDTVNYSASGESSEIFTYYADGSLETVTDATGTTTYEYYDNRLLKAIQYNYTVSGLTPVQRVEYIYYPEGALHVLTWKSDGVVIADWTYDYDNEGRILSVTSFGDTATFGYDGEGKRLTQTNSNGTDTIYGYNDGRDWLTGISHRSGGVAYASYGLTYDLGNDTVGNLTGVTELDGDTVTYGYDDLYRLTTETRTGTNAYAKSYGYDLAGNLTTLDGSLFATYDSANKISTLTGGSVSNDADGNLTAVSGSGIPSSTLVWNSKSKLISHTLSVETTTFGYDAAGLRIWSQNGEDPKRFYIFAGENLVGEIENGIPVSAYAWEGNRLVWQRNLSSGSSLWYAFGPQGETRYLTDELGAVVDSYLYTAYGVPLSSAGTDYNPFRYGGRYGYYTIEANHLVLAGQRWYSPGLTRWLSRDPIKYNGGVNLYAYVWNEPADRADPFGLVPDWNLLAPRTDISNRANQLINNVSQGGTMTIVGHGAEDYITGPDGRRYSPEEVAEMLMGPELKPHLNRARMIQLYSCNTGKGKDPFGKRLRERLKALGFDIPVRAPNTDVSLAGDNPSLVAVPGEAPPSWVDFGR